MYNVGGFLFEDEETAAQARKEEEGIRFIKEKSKLTNPEVVLKIYQTVLQQKLFMTPVGLRFLVELQNFLLTSPDVDKAEIPAIDTSSFIKAIVVEKEVPVKRKFGRAEKKERVQTASAGSYKTAFHVSLFFAVIFGVSVLGMFVIAELSGNNVNIINYRNEIINQYEKWEQELESEEDRLKEWEQELEQREEALEGAGTTN